MHLGQPQRRLLVIDPSVALDPAPDADDVDSDANTTAPNGARPADAQAAGR